MAIAHNRLQVKIEDRSALLSAIVWIIHNVVAESLAKSFILIGVLVICANIATGQPSGDQLQQASQSLSFSVVAASFDK